MVSRSRNMIGLGGYFAAVYMQNALKHDRGAEYQSFLRGGGKCVAETVLLPTPASFFFFFSVSAARNFFL